MRKDLSPETGPKTRVFFHYVIPSVLGMIAVSSASVIDGIFVGQFAGAEALAAVNLTIPLIRTAFNGFSEFINEISAGIVIFIFNLVMMRRFGPSGVAAFTIINYILFFGLMICYGVADALQPLLSTNFGARQEERISGFMRLGLLANGGIGITVTAVILLFPGPLIGIFLHKEAAVTIATARTFLLYFWPAMLINGLNIAFSSSFTSLHKAAHSAAIALSRSLGLPVLFVLALSALIGDVGIFIAIPLAEFATLFLSLAFFFRNRPQKVLAAAG